MIGEGEILSKTSREGRWLMLHGALSLCIAVQPCASLCKLYLQVTSRPTGLQLAKRGAFMGHILHLVVCK
jgi:hypothetical protein